MTKCLIDKHSRMKIPLVGNFVQSKFVSFPFSMAPAAGEKVLADSERGEFQLD